MTKKDAMNILIAPDSFKGSLDAIKVCRAIQSGFSQVFAEATYTLLPMADGGEGTAAVLSYALNGRWMMACVHDPLMRPIRAKYLLLPDNTAVIEIAQACGLPLLTSAERNPLVTSSYGVGELMIDALHNGAKRFIIGLGGSATNDAGLGMLMALGIRFYDKNDNQLSQGGAQLADLQRIDTALLHPEVAEILAQKEIAFEVACDVTNPLCGITGASAVFGPQKGANPQQVEILDQALANFADIVARQNTQSDDHLNHHNAAGAGAAGGLGFALIAFCGAKLQSGFEIVAEATHLAAHIAKADVVITGEGQLDAQTLMGKVASGVGIMARAEHKPIIAICGAIDNDHNALPFDIVMPSIQRLAPIDEILATAYTSVQATAANLAAAMRLGQQMNDKW